MDRRLGGPLPHQLANQTRVHLIPPEFFTLYHAIPCAYAVLAVVSNCYPPVWGRLPTRYSPVRHSVTKQSLRRVQVKCFVRLACVKHAASVHPEPGSNSHVKVCHLSMSCPVFKLAYQFPFACPLIYCFKVVSFIKKRSCAVVTAPWNSLNLSRLFHYLIIKVLFWLPLFLSQSAWLF